MKIYSPVVEYLHLQIRFNLRTRAVEIRTSDQTEDVQSLQKAGASRFSRRFDRFLISLFLFSS